MKVYHLLHKVGYLHHLSYGQVCKVCRSNLVKIGLYEKNPSSFASDSSIMSTYLVICDDKKPNLLLKELILS